MEVDIVNILIFVKQDLVKNKSTTRHSRYTPTTTLVVCVNVNVSSDKLKIMFIMTGVSGVYIHVVQCEMW